MSLVFTMLIYSSALDLMDCMAVEALSVSTAMISETTSWKTVLLAPVGGLYRSSCSPQGSSFVCNPTCTGNVSATTKLKAVSPSSQGWHLIAAACFLISVSSSIVCGTAKPGDASSNATRYVSSPSHKTKFPLWRV
jgi:hypothetical protein